MSEELNDNLPQADGNPNPEMQENFVAETPEQETQIIENEEIAEAVAAPVVEEAVAEPDNIVELTDEQVADDSIEFADENSVAVEAINHANAEENEDESIKARHDIPLQDYEALPMDKLVAEMELLIGSDKIMSVREHVEEIKRVFVSKFKHLLDEKRDEWKAQNPETTESFHYDFPLKHKFDALYSKYQEKRNAHFKSIEKALQDNLQTRHVLIDELKAVIHSQNGNIAQSLKQIAEIRERWKNAGPIPKDKYNTVWNTYNFYLEQFYDILDLDREARNNEFKNNLEQKQKIIARVEELLNEEDSVKSFRELQDLHRIWKEDIGPVSREDRETLWEKFSELTKKMHDKREAFFEGFRAVENENLEKKKGLIAQIEELAKEKVNSHSAWQKQIEKVEALRNSFFATGKVPNEVNEETWTSFKNAVRDFNVLKNSFYKDIKKEQNDNLSKKQTLVDKANSLKDSEDFASTTPLMKQIQEEWKTVGHIPKKFSDALWTEFRAACNHYFERLKDSRKEVDADELAAYENKKNYLETLRSFELEGKHKEDLDAIKAHIEHWKGLGKVPANKRHIESKFNKILDVLFEKLSSSKKEGEMMRFANRLDNADGRKLDNERVFITRKIDEVQHEIFQLENNIQFFGNASSDNPMVKEVQKNIERHKEELQLWKEKLKQLKNHGKKEEPVKAAETPETETPETPEE